jgi:hypothetical protein
VSAWRSGQAAKRSGYYTELWKTTMAERSGYYTELWKKTTALLDHIPAPKNGRFLGNITRPGPGIGCSVASTSILLTHGKPEHGQAEVGDI